MPAQATSATTDPSRSGRDSREAAHLMDFEELDKLSTAELHHRAVKAAEHHLDIAFFWRLLEYIPIAEAMSGSEARADTDIEHISVWMHDYANRDGTLDEALRPVYIDYLEHHSESGDG
jgi:hypothetical protein